MDKLQPYVKVLKKLWRCDDVSSQRIVEQRRGLILHVLQKIDAFEKCPEDFTDADEDEIRSRMEWLIANPQRGCEVVRETI